MIPPLLHRSHFSGVIPVSDEANYYRTRYIWLRHFVISSRSCPDSISSLFAMFSVRFPDWKKVGKKLRDILNPPVDTGPSREERRARRLRDGLKGFVYLDDFDELKAWSQEDIDPIQRANTPLMKRSASAVHNHNCPTTSLLLCHDHSGLLPYIHVTNSSS